MGVSQSFNAPAQRMHKVPTVPVENNRRGILGPRFGKGRSNIGRAERCDRLLNEVDTLRLTCVPHRLGCRDEAEFYRPSSDSPG